MKAQRGLEKFSGGGPQSDYSVCPHPLRRVFDFSGFWFSGFRVFGFSGLRVFRFSGSSDGTGCQVFWTGRDVELDNRIK